MRRRFGICRSCGREMSLRSTGVRLPNGEDEWICNDCFEDLDYIDLKVEPERRKDDLDEGDDDAS